MKVVAIKNNYETIYSFRTQGQEWEHVGGVFTLGYMLIQLPRKPDVMIGRYACFIQADSHSE